MMKYETISAEKRLQRQGKIPQQWLLQREKYQDATNLMDVPTTCGVLTNIESDITSNHDATDLLRRMADGTWSAEQVTVAFCKRAAIAQQLVRSYYRLEN